VAGRLLISFSLAARAHQLELRVPQENPVTRVFRAVRVRRVLLFPVRAVRLAEVLRPALFELVVLRVVLVLDFPAARRERLRVFRLT
jgi:hypothetical protein